MSEVALRTVVSTQVAVYTVRRRLEILARDTMRRLREERGQDLIEYGGVLAIIALIIGAIFVTGFWSTVASTITNTVSSILNGHGSSTATGGK